MQFNLIYNSVPNNEIPTVIKDLTLKEKLKTFPEMPRNLGSFKKETEEEKKIANEEIRKNIEKTIYEAFSYSEEDIEEIMASDKFLEYINELENNIK